MVSSHHRSFAVADRSFLSLIKKDVHKMAADGGFPPAQLGVIDIIIAEIGSNFVKHAGGGELLIRVNTGYSMDILAIDSGKGMRDPGSMMEDGMSTTNTLGGGLGAIKRLSDHCEVYSQVDWGTIIYAQVLVQKNAVAVARQSLNTYSLLVPYPGEQVCGDGFVKIKSGHNELLFLGDGLGHGIHAHEAVMAAEVALRSCMFTKPDDILRYVHEAVKKTRGLVGSLAIYHPGSKQWQLCGVGNIHTRIQGGAINKGYLPYNGIIGHTMPRTINDQFVAGLRGQNLILCSDGIRTRWDLAKYPSIYKYSPAIVAAVLYKDFNRRSDDASVIVSRMI